jgi:hypothetical protein
VLNQPGAEADQRCLRKRRLRVVHAVQHQLPAPIHHRRLQHLVVGGAGVGLQDRRQAKLGRRDRRLPDRGILVHPGELMLQVGVEQLVAVLAQPHKQPGALDPLDHFPLQPRALHRRLPHPWTHHSTTHAPGGTPSVPLEPGTYLIRIPVRL